MLFLALAALVASLTLLVMLILSRQKFRMVLQEAETVSQGLRKGLRTETERLAATKADKQAAEQSLEKASTNLETLTSRLDTANEKAASARNSEQEAVQRIIILEVEAKHLRDQATNIEPETLWALELQRTERTWRHSVSIAPDSNENPFANSEDHLRTAVEIEAAALKEEAGAFISVDWQAAPVEDAARSHLILRLAQEMLAEAAREPIPVRLLATGTGAITLSLEPSEEADEGVEIDLHPPNISGRLVEVADSRRPQITIKYA